MFVGFLRGFSLLVLLLSSAAASATTLVPKDAEQLSAESKSILHVRVRKTSTRQTTSPRSVFTDVTFDILDTLKGNQAGAKQIELSFEGGQLSNGRRLHLAGCPEFEANDEAIIFVARFADSSCPLVGWQQGALRVVEAKQTNSKLVSYNNLLISAIDAGRFQTADSSQARPVPSPLRSLSGVSAVRVETSNSPASAAPLSLVEFKDRLRTFANVTPYQDPKRRITSSQLSKLAVTPESENPTSKTVSAPGQIPLKQQLPSAPQGD